MPSLRTWLWVGGLGALLASLFLGRKRIGVTVEKVFEAAGRAAFASVLPSRARPYLDALLAAAREFDISPFTLYGLVDRESLWGDYLQPRGPAGTGDPTPRWKTARVLDTSYAFARKLDLLSGKTRVNTKGETEHEVLPPMRGGATVPGWGYGLGQADYAAFSDFIESGEWRDPAKALRKTAAILSNKLRFFMLPSQGVGDPRPLTGRALLDAGIAAYNAGEGNVLAALKRGAAPDSVTTGKDYGGDLVRRAESIAEAFKKLVS